MNYCFVFGHEPWLLPPALEMIDVIRKNGNSVDVIYAEYLGGGVAPEDYNNKNTFAIIKKGNKVRHILKYLSLAINVNKLQKIKKIDIIIACDILPLHVLVNVKTKAKKGYWCFEEPHDTQNKLSLDYYRKKKQKEWINSMDFLLMPSQSRKESIYKKFQLTIPSAVIYNCKKSTNHHTVESEKFDFLSFKKILVYTGKISPAQFIEEIVDAMSLLPDDIGLVLAGSADQDYLNNILEKVSKDVSLNKRIAFLGRITREQVYELIELADIGFVLYGTDSNGNEIDPAPNKLGDYIAGRTWVIGSGQAYLKYWLDDKGAGVSVDIIDKHSIAHAVNRILSEHAFVDKSVLTRIYNEELNMDTQYEKLVSLIETL